jgi:hypothetical protein
MLTGRFNVSDHTVFDLHSQATNHNSSAAGLTLARNPVCVLAPDFALRLNIRGSNPCCPKPSNLEKILMALIAEGARSTVRPLWLKGNASGHEKISNFADWDSLVVGKIKIWITSVVECHKFPILIETRRPRRTGCSVGLVSNPRSI